MRCWPTKEQVEHDYYDLKLTMMEIVKKYGYRNELTGRKWFREYGIIPRPTLLLQKPEKEVLVHLYNVLGSVNKVADRLGRNPNFIAKCLKDYGIKIRYFKNDICNDTLQKELYFISIKEAAIKYNTTVKTIKSRINFIPKVEYNLERIKSILNLYDYDSRGTSKAISFDDVNVKRFIFEHTKNHKLQGNKITERVYRLLYDYPADYEALCIHCGAKLKFYTFAKGYGASDLKICSNCIVKQSGTSRPSQELFWNVYSHLKLEEKYCNFAELNHEKTLTISTEDKQALLEHTKMNKRKYSLDFVYKNKIIEYDGTYWHSDLEKEAAKEAFLNHKGYTVLHILDDDYQIDPEKELNKCIDFLTK